MNNNLNEIGSIETIRRIWRSYASGLTGYLTVALLCNAIVALSTPALPELIRRVIDDIFMVKNLGHKNYVVQGGDWGATVASWIGFDSAKNCWISSK